MFVLQRAMQSQLSATPIKLDGPSRQVIALQKMLIYLQWDWTRKTLEIIKMTLSRIKSIVTVMRVFALTKFVILITCFIAYSKLVGHPVSDQLGQDPGATKLYFEKNI